MRILQKIVPYQGLIQWRDRLAPEKRPLIATNGCFDCLHVGHIHLLAAARELGNTLLVGVTSDQGIRHLKGPGRPATQQNDRLIILAALEMVDFVCVFPEIEATGFLQKARPDVYVKGADYTVDTINQTERAALEAMHCQIRFVPRFEGRSTTTFLHQIQSREPELA
jgi:rfaE bifunctional protein nucleotidyltransferase chain/domain